MNMKKFALCVISMIAALMFANTGTAFAEDSFETKELVSEETEVVLDNNAASIAGIDAVGNVINVEGVLPAAHEENYTVMNGAQESSDDEASEKQTQKKPSKIKNRKKAKYTKAELRLMSAIIFCEAGNQSYAGKLAVGIVVMNRKESRSFASTVKGVIYQRGQFSPVRNGSLSRALRNYDAGKFTSRAHKQCIRAAKEALSGVKTVKLNGKTKNMKSFHYFSGYLRGSRLRIGGHSFK